MNSIPRKGGTTPRCDVANEGATRMILIPRKDGTSPRNKGVNEEVSEPPSIPSSRRHLLEETVLHRSQEETVSKQQRRRQQNQSVDDDCSAKCSPLGSRGECPGFTTSGSRNQLRTKTIASPFSDANPFSSLALFEKKKPTVTFTTQFSS